jgi:hypothetical protein
LDDDSREARLRYSLCGLSLDSDESFPELAQSTSSESNSILRLRREHRITTAGETLRLAAEWTLPDGRPFLVSWKTENGYLLKFIDLVDFFIDHAGTDVVFSPQPEAPADSVRHLFLDSVIPLTLSLRNHAVLHASATVTPFGACAFAAATGTGKSTLSASFQKAGYASITDDCLLLEREGAGFYARASYPSVRLRQDSLTLIQARHDATLSVAHYNSKRRFGAGLFANGRHPLAAIYCLERPRQDDARIREPLIEAFSGQDSLLAALRYLFCLDPRDPTLLIRQFKLLEGLVSEVPILRLTIPSDFSALPRVHEVVLSDLETRGSAAGAHQ